MATATPKTRRTKTVDSIIRSRQPRAGLAYKLSPSSLGMDLVHENVSFDEKLMKATGVISTPTVDRVGDLLIPTGGRFENYQKNPVVLWNHGFGFDKPIATSRDSSGGLAIRVNDEFVEADSFFSQKLKEAEEIFGLIVEGIVKATSVRETPIKSSFKRDPEYGDVLIVDEWELEEWSWVPVGCNPDAVAKSLNRKRKLSEPIYKSLLAVAPELKRFGIGFEETSMAKKTAKKSYAADELKAMSDDELAACKAGGCDDDTMKAIDDELASRADDTEMDDSAETDAVDTGTEPDAAKSPYGSQVLSAIHAALTAALSNLQQAMGPLENPEVKAGLESLMASLGDQVTAIEGLHSSTYADQPGLKMDTEADQAATESLKSFLASGRMPQLQLQGVGARLKALASSGLNKQQRAAIADIAGQLNRIVTQAKSHKPQPAAGTPDPALIDLQKKMTDFRKELTATA